MRTCSTARGSRRRLDPRRDQVAAILEQAAGPVVHNPTRGYFVGPNELQYGGFLKEWSAIYERFGVPAEIGLAQALLESGFNGTRRSRAGAIGFCQLLAVNWNRLKRLSPHVDRGAQPDDAGAALRGVSDDSRHALRVVHPRAVRTPQRRHSTSAASSSTAGRLGGGDVRDRYFIGSQFARDLRRIALYRLPRHLPHLWPALGALRRDGVRQRVQVAD